MIIITAPHVCGYKILGLFEDTSCDANTLQFARIIHSQVPSSSLVVSTNARGECDNNRYECRMTRMRKILRSMLANKRSSVIEVHSFDAGGQFKLLWTPQVILLDTYTSDETMKLFNNLRGNGIDTIAIIGSSKNDIQKETREYGYKAVLIELHSKLSTPIVEKIGDVIRDTFSP